MINLIYQIIMIHKLIKSFQSGESFHCFKNTVCMRPVSPPVKYHGKVPNYPGFSAIYPIVFKIRKQSGYLCFLTHRS